MGIIVGPLPNLVQRLSWEENREQTATRRTGMRSIAALSLAILAAACSGGTTTTSVPATAHLAGTVTAGPTCPVVQEGVPCPDRPVVDAAIQIIDGNGAIVVEVITDEDGAYAVDLAPGRYHVVPQSVEGLLGTAAPVDVTVAADSTIVLDFAYDTGIR